MSMILHHYACTHAAGRLPLVYIPGFASSAQSLDEICRLLSTYTTVYAVDLPGFGDAPLPEDPLDCNRVLEDLHATLTETITGKYILGGYSMGGRIALNYALQYQHTLGGLILESTSPGIALEAERNKRLDADEQLAQYILNHSIQEFAEYWVKLPVFHSLEFLSPEKQRANFDEKLRCSKNALIRALKLFGQGIMAPVHEQLPTLALPVLLLAGQLDEKYLAINAEMLTKLPNCRFHIVPASGHNIHLEKTSEFINLVLSFLNQLKEKT